MEFIQDNYVWFIVGGVILLMALIGYIAEKTDFGKRKFTSKTETEKVVTKDKKVESTPSVIAEPEIIEPLDIEPEVIENETEPFMEQEPMVEVEQNVDNDRVEPIFLLDEDLDVPFGDQPVNPVQPEDFTTVQIKEDIFEQPFDNKNEDLDDTNKSDQIEEMVLDVPNVDNTNPEEELPLPDIDELKKEKVDDEEDVWKF